MNEYSVTTSSSPSLTVTFNFCSVPEVNSLLNVTLRVFVSSSNLTSLTVLPSNEKFSAFNLSKAVPFISTVLVLIALTLYQN